MLSPISLLKRKTRFEPRALALARRCSTAELLPHGVFDDLFIITNKIKFVNIKESFSIITFLFKHNRSIRGIKVIKSCFMEAKKEWYDCTFDYVIIANL